MQQHITETRVRKIQISTSCLSPWRHLGIRLASSKPSSTLSFSQAPGTTWPDVTVTLFGLDLVLSACLYSRGMDATQWL